MTSEMELGVGVAPKLDQVKGLGSWPNRLPTITISQGERQADSTFLLPFAVPFFSQAEIYQPVSVQCSASTGSLARKT